MTARLLRTLACLALTFVLVGTAVGEGITNAGKEFMVGFLKNGGSGQTVQLHLTAPETTQVTVQYPVNSPTLETTVDVVAGDVTIVDLPVSAAAGWTNNTIGNNAVRAFSPTNDVFVCYMINVKSYMSDAGLALPVNALNTEYILTTYASSDAEYLVIAPYDDTEVTITPHGGSDTVITLNRGEAYFGWPGSDATGTVISASRPVAVTNGNSCTSIDDGACDHIFEMAVPVAAWGTSSPVANIPEDTTGTRYKIVASVDATTVTKDGVSIGEINRGEFIFTEKLPGDYIIGADKPFFVTQFMDNREDSGGDPIGDPAIGNMGPSDQYLNSYTFSTVGGGQFIEHYVSIIAHNDDVGTLTLDGTPVDAGEYSAIVGSDYSVARVLLTDGVHSTASGNGHGITVMGFNGYDSYLYTGGAQFAFINPGSDPWDPVCDCTLEAGPPKVFECTASDNHAPDGDDEDTGIFSVELLSGSDNIELEVDELIPGDATATYRITRTDDGAAGTGTVRVTDGAGNTCDYVISFDSVANTDPVADAGGPYTAGCGANGGTVALDATGSSDADDGDSIASYAWSSSSGAVSFSSTSSAQPTVTIDGDFGTYTVQVLVTDQNGGTDTDTATITFADTTGPAISTQASDLEVSCDDADAEDQLAAWLADHGGATAADACGGTVTWTHNGANLDIDCATTGTTTVTFTATDAEGNTSTTSASFVVATAGEVDLEITVTRVDGNGETETPIVVNDTIEYEITVRNIGTANASQVTVTVPVPEGTEIVSSSLVPQSGRATTETLTFDVGDLDIGATFVIRLVLRVLTEGDLDLEASADSAETDKTTTNNSTQATAAVQTAEDVVVTTVTYQFGLCGALGVVPLSMLLVGLIAMRSSWGTRNRSRHG